MSILNAQKDEINNLGSCRFTAETKQQLTNFYSINMASVKRIMRPVKDMINPGVKSVPLFTM